MRHGAGALDVLDEFRDMVKALHRAGIEVILDVVFNHTAEGGDDGPTLCYRGLANDFYYILETDQSRYADYTGCGNTLNANQSDRAAADPGQPALLGDRDARRRLPLRSRVGPVARRDRPSAAQSAGALGYRVGSAAGRHQADRRAVGCRRPLSGGQLRRRPLAGVERPVPRRRAPLPQGRQRLRCPASPRGCSAARTSTVTRNGSRSRASTS